MELIFIYIKLKYWNRGSNKKNPNFSHQKLQRMRGRGDSTHLFTGGRGGGGDGGWKKDEHILSS